jgi:hypothetical protein
MHPFLSEEIERSISMLVKGQNPAPRFRIAAPAGDFMVHLHPGPNFDDGHIRLLVAAVGYFMARHAATSYVFTAVYRGPDSYVGDALFACEADRARADAVVHPIASFDPLQLDPAEHYRLPHCPIAFDASLLLSVTPPPPDGLSHADWPHLLTTLFRRGLLTLAPETTWLTGAGRVLN